MFSVESRDWRWEEDEEKMEVRFRFKCSLRHPTFYQCPKQSLQSTQYNINNINQDIMIHYSITTRARQKYTTRQMQVSLGTAEPPVVAGSNPATPAVLSRKDPVTARKQKAEIPEQQMRLLSPGHTAPNERNSDTGKREMHRKTRHQNTWTIERDSNNKDRHRK